MRRVLSVLAVAIATVTLAACGGGEDEETTTVTTVAPATTVAGQGPVFTGDPNSAFCTVARANIDRIRSIGESFVSGGGTAIDDLLRDAAPAVREAVSLAPDAIKDDAEVLADGFDALLASAETGQIDTSIVLDAKFQAAAQNLTIYGRQVCGVTG